MSYYGYNFCVQLNLPMLSHLLNTHPCLVLSKKIEPLLRGHLSFKTTFSLYQTWPFNTGLTEFCSISEAKPKEDGKVSEEKDVDTTQDDEDTSPKPKALHKTCSIFLRNLAPSITKQEVEAVSNLNDPCIFQTSSLQYYLPLNYISTRNQSLPTV